MPPHAPFGRTTLDHQLKLVLSRGQFCRRGDPETPDVHRTGGLGEHGPARTYHAQPELGGLLHVRLGERRGEHSESAVGAGVQEVGVDVQILRERIPVVTAGRGLDDIAAAPRESSRAGR